MSRRGDISRYRGTNNNEWLVVSEVVLFEMNWGWIGLRVNEGSGSTRWAEVAH